MNKNLRKKLITVVAASALAACTVMGLASCKKEKISYSFNTDGGVAISDVKLNKGEEYELPIPEKEGYAFEGWYTNAEFKGDPVTKIVAEEGATYYAKWAKLAVITLNLDGGSLSETTLYLKTGENVHTFMQAYTPTKSGLTFGAWFNGDKELSTGLKMPEAGLTLTAKYKVAYTAEIYLQKFDLSGYERAEDVVLYDYVGASIQSEPEMTGFKEVVKEDTVASKDALSANAAENLFRHYFDRESYTVTFDPNYPVEDTDTNGEELVTSTVLYGTEIVVPNDYVCEGYCLVGWSTSVEATEATYNAYYIDTVLYGKEGEARTADSFKPERNTALYAVWAKGYVELFGSSDNVYLLGEEGTAYLARGNVFFEGEYDADKQEVYFGNLVGKLYDNNTFSYYNDGKIFTLRNGKELDKDVTITLIDNTVTYTDNGEQSQGTFVKGEEEGCFEITYTSGALAGQEMGIKTMIVSITDEDGKTSDQAVFNIRNEEVAALDTLLRIAVNADGTLTPYYPIISFDGFGIATVTLPDSESTYYYTMDGNRFTLSSSEGGSSALDGLLTEINGVKVYVLYEETLDQSYTLPSGDVLTLDGGCEATYTVDGVTKTGNFNASQSQFGTLITYWQGSDEYKFLIREHKKEDAIVGGGTSEVTYTIESKPVTYGEYRYVQDGSVYYAPLLVLDETVEGKATLYAKKSEAIEYVKVSVGGYQLVEDYYVYTVEEEFAVEELDQNPFDLTQIKSIVFQTNASATEYSLMYWKAYTTEADVTTDYVVDYTSANGETLKLVGGFAFLKPNDGPMFVGAYFTKDGLTTILKGDESRYVELFEDKTFTLYLYAPYKANLLTENDAVNSAEYIEFDGKGKATYVKVIIPATKDTPAVTETKEGSTAATNKTTLAGETIYEFTANDFTFKYINVPDTNYIARWNETYNGEYETAEGILTLDGFGLNATFKSVNGTTSEGLYTVTAENEITFFVEEEEKIYYFDLKENRKYTIRGEEYGSYLFVENQGIEAFIDLDGYGKASIYTLKEVDGESVEDYIDANAQYEIDGEKITVRYSSGNETVEAKLSTMTVDGTEYNAVII
ncbi:MAG: InlB B-repeat-containing protein, partial [Clostridia bacterium]|nr:InlB B-repeat-containing protein [Clostridia bacterium]